MHKHPSIVALTKAICDLTVAVYQESAKRLTAEVGCYTGLYSFLKCSLLLELFYLNSSQNMKSRTKEERGATVDLPDAYCKLRNGPLPTPLRVDKSLFPPNNYTRLILFLLFINLLLQLKIAIENFPADCQAEQLSCSVSP